MSIGFQELLNKSRVAKPASAISKKALRCRMRTFLLNLEGGEGIRKDRLIKV